MPDHIAIIGAGRTGSRMLFELIRKIPNFAPTPTKEILNNVYTPNHLSGSKFRELATFIRENQSQIVITHVKVRYFPIYLGGKEINLRTLIEKLIEIGFTKFIFLRRDNLFRQRLSSLRSKYHIVDWHPKKEIKKNKKITINVKESLDNIKLQQEFQQELRNIWSTLGFSQQRGNFLELIYEQDILRNYLIAIKKITDFAKIKIDQRKIPKTKFKIANPFLVKDCVNNFNELQQVFKGTGLEWMINH